MEICTILYIGDMNETYSNGTKREFRFEIKDYSDEPDPDSNDIYGQLIRSDILYFTSSHSPFYGVIPSSCQGFDYTGWEFVDTASWPALDGGLKLRVFVDGYRSNMETKESVLDIANSEEVSDMQYAIGQLGRMLILQQFSEEQRVRSEGIKFIHVLFLRLENSIYTFFEFKEYRD